MKRMMLGVGAIALCGVVPQVAVGHDATVTCVDGQYVVKADNLQRNPTWTFDEISVTVRWNNGVIRRILLPEGCVEGTPQPAPVPPVPELVPPPASPPPTAIIPPVIYTPPTCAELLARYPLAGPVRRANWGCPARPIVKLPPKPDKPPRASSIRYYPCPGVGKRSRVVITVTTSSGKTGRVTRWGKICKLPAVTG